MKDACGLRVKPPHEVATQEKAGISLESSANAFEDVESSRHMEEQHVPMTRSGEIPLPAPDPHPQQSPNGAFGGDDDELYLMEQFMQNPAHDYHKFRYGDTVDGTIMRIDKDGILVNIGTKAEALVPMREMQSLMPEDRANLHIGDVVLVFIIQAEDKDDYAILSIDKARQERSWRRLQQAFQDNDIIEAQVVNYNKGGLLVNLDGIRGFVPSSQINGIGRGTDAQKQSEMARMIGRDMQLKVIEISRSRNRLILSERQASQDMREGKKNALLTVLKEGDICSGVVSSVCNFGAFVDIGGADGLVHLSELSWGRVKHPEEILKVGQSVQVAILGIDNDRKRIALSLKRTHQEPWATANERYQIGQIVEGTITQIASFGAFARIENGIEGLIHVSELSNGTVQHPRDIVSEGDIVQARIIRIDSARKRMGLSLLLRTAESVVESTVAEAPEDDELVQSASGHPPMLATYEKPHTDADEPQL